MKKRALWDFAGVIIGIIIAIYGIIMLNSVTVSYPTTIPVRIYSQGSTGSFNLPLKFGADFYTEIYDVTYDINNSVNSLHTTVTGLGERLEDIETVLVKNTISVLGAFNKIYDCLAVLVIIIGTVMILVFGKRSSEAIAEMPKKPKYIPEYYTEEEQSQAASSTDTVEKNTTSVDEAPAEATPTAETPVAEAPAQSENNTENNA